LPKEGTAELQVNPTMEIIPLSGLYK